MTYSLKPPHTSHSRLALLAMIAATALCLIAAGLGVVGAIVSPMLFDGPVARFNPAVWLGFVLTIGFWAVCLLGPFVGWVFWSRGDMPRAWAFMAAPLAWGMATLAVLQFLPLR
jgi:hypothetical protein